MRRFNDAAALLHLLLLLPNHLVVFPALRREVDVCLSDETVLGLEEGEEGVINLPPSRANPIRLQSSFLPLVQS